MTTAKDIVQDSAELIDSINGLVKNNTVEAALKVANLMGLQPQVNDGVDGLLEVLTDINARLELIREPLVHMGALAALIRIIDPLFAGLGRLVDTSQEELASAGLGPLLVFASNASGGVSNGRKFLVSGERVLTSVPTEKELDDLKISFDGLSETLETYKRPVSTTI